MRGQVYMSKKLEKAKFKGLMNDCRQLWNEFEHPAGNLKRKLKDITEIVIRVRFGRDAPG